MKLWRALCGVTGGSHQVASVRILFSTVRQRQWNLSIMISQTLLTSGPQG
jgi:hypothetical protein